MLPAANFGNLITSANDRPNTVGNSTRGIFGGGELSVSPFAMNNVIQYIEYSSLGNFADFGDYNLSVT